jgi:hypothetical protein
VQFAGDFLKSELVEDDELAKSFVTARGSPTQESNYSESGYDVGSEGIQVLAVLIDNILARVKVIVKDISISIRYKSPIDIFSNEPQAETLADNFDYEFILSLPHISFTDSSPTMNTDIAESDILQKTSEDEMVKSIEIRGFQFDVRRENPPDFVHSETHRTGTLLHLPVEDPMVVQITIKPENHQGGYSFPLSAGTIMHWSVSFEASEIVLALSPKRLSLLSNFISNFNISHEVKMEKGVTKGKTKEARRGRETSTRLDINKEILEGSGSIFAPSNKSFPKSSGHASDNEQFFDLDINEEMGSDSHSDRKSVTKSSRGPSPSGSSILSSFSMESLFQSVKLYFFLSTDNCLSSTHCTKVSCSTSQHLLIHLSNILVKYKALKEMGYEEGDIRSTETNIVIEDLLLWENVTTIGKKTDTEYNQLCYFKAFNRDELATKSADAFRLEPESDTTLPYVTQMSMKTKNVEDPATNRSNSASAVVNVQPLVFYIGSEFLSKFLDGYEKVDTFQNTIQEDGYCDRYDE